MSQPMVRNVSSRQRWLTGLLVGGGLLSGLLLVSRCFSPELPVCSYRCYSNDLGAPLCPSEYECRSDGYCHQRGSSEACPYSMDLAPFPGLPDFASRADLASHD